MADTAAVPSDPLPDELNDAQSVAVVSTALGPRAQAPRAIRAIGREPDFEAIDALFEESRALVLTESAVAAGQGGVGKTWVARAYAAARPDTFPRGAVVLPLHAPDRVGLEIAGIGARLGLAETGTFQERLAATFRGLAASGGHLLVLDDCPHADALRNLSAQLPETATLATARRAPWAEAEGLPRHLLGPLDGRLAARLVARDRRDLNADEADLVRIAADLGQVPEALDFAARSLAADRDGDFRDPFLYLQLLRRVPIEQLSVAIRGEVRRPAGNEAAVLRAAAVAIGQLRITHGPDVTALRMLRLACAFVPGQPFPERVLRQAALNEPNPADTPQVAQGFKRLLALGLLRADGPKPGVHVPPIVAAYLNATDAERVTAARGVVEGTAAQWLSQALVAEQTNEILDWQPHLHALAEQAETRRSRRAGHLITLLGHQLRALGEPQVADALLARARDLGPR